MGGPPPGYRPPPGDSLLLLIGEVGGHLVSSSLLHRVAVLACRGGPRIALAGGSAVGYQEEVRRALACRHVSTVCVTVVLTACVMYSGGRMGARSLCFMLAAATSRNVLGLGGTSFGDLPDGVVAPLCVGMPPMGMPGGPPVGMPGGPPGGFQRPPPGAYGPPGGFPPQGAGAPPQGLPPPPMQPMQ